MNKPILLLIVAVAVTDCSTYVRPVHSRYPWNTYTTESPETTTTRNGALEPSTSDRPVSVGGTHQRTSSEIAEAFRILCVLYSRGPCEGAIDRRLLSGSSSASVSPGDGNDLKTSPSEFYFRNSGGEDNRVYGSRSRSYHGHSAFVDNINGQTFNSRSFVLPLTPAVPIRFNHGGIFPYFFGNVNPRKTFFYVYTSDCNACKTGDGSTTDRPAVATKSTWIPKIYRTSTETVEITATTIAPETVSKVSTRVPEDTSAASTASKESLESSEYDEKVETTTDLPTVTTTIPDYAWDGVTLRHVHMNMHCFFC